MNVAGDHNCPLDPRVVLWALVGPTCPTAVLKLTLVHSPCWAVNVLKSKINHNFPLSKWEPVATASRWNPDLSTRRSGASHLMSLGIRFLTYDSGAVVSVYLEALLTGFNEITFVKCLA